MRFSIRRVALSRGSSFMGEAILTGTSRMPAMERSTPPGQDREGTDNDLAYALWSPDDPGTFPGVVVVHGAGSRKENHADFARLATANDWAALTFDLPGHGESEPAFSGSAVDDLFAMADLLAVQPEVDQGRVALRGSSLGGFLAISAAA